MRETIILCCICLSIIFSFNCHAFLYEKGQLDLNNNSFLYTGGNFYFWSGYKSDEYRKKLNTIFKYNFSGSRQEIFYEGNQCLYQLETSHDGEYFSVLAGGVSKVNVETLLIIDRKGSKLIELSDKIREYTWHPKRNSIFYTSGDLIREGDDFTISSRGIWCYDVEKREKRKLSEKGMNVRTVSFDDHIYFDEGNMTLKYDIDAQKTEDAGIDENTCYYSPNGRYYYYYMDATLTDSWEAPYYSPFRLFDTKSNEIMPAEKLLYISERRPGDVEWVNGKNTIIFRGNKSRTNYEQLLYIYNVESNQLIKTFKGRVAGIGKDRNVVIIYRNGMFFKEIIN